MKKIAVFFPGLGYSTERPLLYYSKKMLKSYDYEIVELDYAAKVSDEITKEIRSNLTNPKTVRTAVMKYMTAALSFCEKQLCDVDFSSCERIIFVSKSIGSVVSAVFAEKHKLSVSQILFTPLEQAFQFAKEIDGIAFSGMSDPVAHCDLVREACEEHQVPFYGVPEGNHSLETGNVQVDVKNLSWIMENVDGYITGLDQSVYNYTVAMRNGGTEKLSDYRGKVLLIVNTATGCGFTPQYQALESMYEKYKDQGFEILDFPCNQFQNQAPGTSDEIYSFCISQYAITFPQFAKIHVNGEQASELFTYLKSRKSFQGFDTNTQIGRFLDRKLSEENPDYAKNSDIKWNFTKFLVDRKGQVIARYEPTADMEELEKDVNQLLLV